MIAYSNTYYKNSFKNRPLYPHLSKDISVDVVIVGGGLAGLSCALELSKLGQSVCVLEENHIGYGASGVNGGFVTNGYACSDEHIKKIVGETTTKKLLDLAYAGVRKVRDNIKKYNIQCDKVEGVIYAARAASEQEFFNHYKSEKNKTARISFYSKSEVRELYKSKVYNAGILEKDSFTINPLKYVYGLARVIVKNKGLIFENSKAISFKVNGKNKTVITKDAKVEAREIIICGSVFLSGFHKKLEESLITISTNILQMKPKVATLNKAITTNYGLVDDRYVMDYYRRLPNNSLLWGGLASALFAHKSKQQFLEADLCKTYPVLRGEKTITYWQGYLGYSIQKMPQIGCLDGIWYSQGFGGHGLNTTAIAGELLASAIVKNDNEYKLFKAFKLRKTFGIFSKIGVEMVYNYQYYKERYLTKLNKN